MSRFEQLVLGAFLAFISFVLTMVYLRNDPLPSAYTHDVYLTILLAGITLLGVTIFVRALIVGSKD